jgi:hypothetical protein
MCHPTVLIGIAAIKNTLHRGGDVGGGVAAGRQGGPTGDVYIRAQ